MMNTMEDNQINNTDVFKPTKELGDFTKFAARCAFGVIKTTAKIEKVARFDDSTISAIFDGTWTIKRDYIRLLALCISRIRPKKVKLKSLPNTLPNRDVLESLENGLVEDLSFYKNTIVELCMIPDKQPKTLKRHRCVITNKGEDFRTSSYYRQISSNNSTLYNFSPPSSDFDYGLSDT